MIALNDFNSFFLSMIINLTKEFHISVDTIDLDRKCFIMSSGSSFLRISPIATIPSSGNIRLSIGPHWDSQYSLKVYWTAGLSPALQHFGISALSTKPFKERKSVK